MDYNRHLEALFGVPFSQQPDLRRLRQFHQKNAFCLDASGQHLLGIAAIDLPEDTVAVTLPAYSHLEYLNLGNNKKLQLLEFTAAIPTLEHLDLNGSGLTILKLPAGFSGLNWLDVSRNALTAFIAEGRYPALHYLDLSDNQLHQFSARKLTDFPKLELLFLQGNQLSSTMQAFASERGSCLADMQRLQRELGKGMTENNEFKVLLVGNGGVGKSCLVERLVYGTFEKQHRSTEGVALTQYHPDGYPYVLNLWDFGGQDIYHATHRLFMQADAIYLVLWDEQTRQNPVSILTEDGEEREYTNHPLGYWLHYVRHQGGESPIIVVKTKKAENDDPHPELQNLKKEYKVHAFTSVDSKLDNKYENGFHRLLGLIDEVIHTKVGIERELPQNHADLRQHLRTLQQQGSKLLTQEAYEDIAALYDVEEPMKVLVQWLVPTGVVFHRAGYFGDAVILDQGWAVEAIYAVFNRNRGEYFRLKDVQRRQGHFSGADLQRVWRAKKYVEAEQELLLQFMLSCELCFEVTEKPEAERYHSTPFADRRFVAPQMLLEEEPSSAELLRQEANRLHVRYRHDFLHYGIIQGFIVRTQQSAEVRDIWQQGIVLQENGAYALVAAEPAPQRGPHASDIYLTCPPGSIALLDKIRNTLEELQGEAVEQWVSPDRVHYVEISALKAAKQEQVVAENGAIVEKADFGIFLGQRPQERYPAPQQTEAGKEQVEARIREVEREPVREIEGEKPQLAFEGEPVLLFAQANPKGDDIDYEGEFLAIQKKLQDKNRTADYRLKFIGAASQEELVDALVEYGPHILHFCGHGETRGLIFHNANKTGSQRLSPDAGEQLVRILKERRPQLQLVFLNACHSRELASAISRARVLAIGTNAKINTKVAESFAAGFYQSMERGLEEAIWNGRILSSLVVQSSGGPTRGLVQDDEFEGELIEAYYNGKRVYPI